MNKMIISLVIVGIIFAGLIFWYSNGNQNNTVAPNGKTEIVKLSSTPGGVYIPNEIKVEAGTLVRIEGDPQTLVSGMDTVVIGAYSINKKISPGDNIIEFIANKPGEYEIRCANFMGNAKLIVE